MLDAEMGETGKSGKSGETGSKEPGGTSQVSVDGGCCWAACEHTATIGLTSCGTKERKKGESLRPALAAESLRSR